MADKQHFIKLLDLAIIRIEEFGKAIDAISAACEENTTSIAA